jgi:type I restriction enzyme, S subunit
VSSALRKETPGLLPGWRQVRLGDVCSKPQYGWTTKATTEGGSIKLLRTTDITPGQIDWSSVPYCSEPPPDLAKYLVQGGDILISRAGSVGVSHLVTKTEFSVFASYLIRFKPGPEILPKYLAHFLKSPSYWRQIADNTAGIAVPNVNASKLQEVMLPLAPLDAQAEILADIEKQFSRLDEAVANLKRVKANLKRYKAAVLKAAVEGRLVPTEAELARREGRSYEAGAQLLQRILEARRSQRKGKGKYKEPVEPDTTDLPELPQRWAWSTFDQVTERVTKGSSPNWQGFSYCDDGIPFVRSHNVGWGETDLSDLAFLPPAFNEIEKKAVLKEGDLLLNIVGASIGRAAIAPKSVEGGNVNQAVAVIRLLESVLRKQYVLIHLLSATSQRRIHSEKVDVARANVSLEDIRAMPLALPPLAEQDRIVGEVDSRLSVVREVEAQADANLKRAQALRLAMLQQAFGPTCRFSQGKPLHAY